MFDDLDRLRDSPALLRLLSHYADAGREDRQTWRDRVMSLDGCDRRELTRLHGELLAFGWVELNAGTVTAKRDAVENAYRVTAAGMKAAKTAVRAAEESAAA